MNDDFVGYRFDPEAFKAHFEGSDLEEAVNNLTEKQLLMAQEYVHRNDMLFEVYSAVMFDAAFSVIDLEDLPL